MNVYLLHFDRLYRHARHYIGITSRTVDERVAEHRAGTGARLMAVIKQAGIDFVVARTWLDVPRTKERSIKKQGGASRICPICKAAQQ